MFYDMLTTVDNNIRFPVKAYVAQRYIYKRKCFYGPPELPKAGMTNNRRLILWGTCYGCKQNKNKKSQSQNLPIVQITLPVLNNVVHCGQNTTCEFSEYAPFSSYKTNSLNGEMKSKSDLVLER